MRRPSGRIAMRLMTERRPFEALRPGDHVQCIGGYDRLTRVEFDGGSATLHYEHQQPNTLDRSNWPNVVVSLNPDGSTRFVPCRNIDGEWREV